MGNGGAAGIAIDGGVGNTVDRNLVMNGSGAGIRIAGGSGNVVGGTAAGSGNTVMGNAGSGIQVTGGTMGRTAFENTARDHVVQGNVIRDNLTGVEVDGNVNGTTIGEQVTLQGVSGKGNVIEQNGGHGVVIKGGAQRVGVQGNTIRDNDGEAMIRLTGVNRSAATAFALTAAVVQQRSGSGPQLVVTGSISNPVYALQQYSVELYANDPSEGVYKTLDDYELGRYLGRATVTADRNGVATFEVKITAPVNIGEVITATATSLRFEPGATAMVSNAVTADIPGFATPR